MPPKPSQVVLVQHGDGFLNGLVPGFARMLNDQLSAASALGSILSERSYRGEVLRFNQWRGSRAVGIEAGRHIPVPEFHKLIEECLQDDSKAGTRDRAIALVVKTVIEIFGKPEVDRILSRVTFHSTPLHASWVNIAEIELSAMTRPISPH